MERCEVQQGRVVGPHTSYFTLMTYQTVYPKIRQQDFLKTDAYNYIETSESPMASTKYKSWIDIKNGHIHGDILDVVDTATLT